MVGELGARLGGARSVRAAAVRKPPAPQAALFRQSWFDTAIDLELGAYGLEGELTPADEWLGDAQKPVLLLEATFYGNSFSAPVNLLLSEEFAAYLQASLPESVDLAVASIEDRALLFEHLLTPLLDSFEEATGHAIALTGGRWLPLPESRADAFALLNTPGGALPVALGADSQPLWNVLTDLNERRIAGKIRRELVIAVGPIALSPEEAAELAEGDTILLEGAMGMELAGELLVEGRPAFSLRVSPATAVVAEAVPVREPDAPPDSELRVALGTLTLSDAEIAALRPGAELAFERSANGTVDLISGGRSIGAGTLVQPDGVLGVMMGRVNRQ